MTNRESGLARVSRAFALAVACFAAGAPLPAQEREEWREWNRPVEPFRIAGNVYYVGASDITAFLIATPAGHVVIDGGFPETAPIIRDGIRKLGFALADVRILLNSHAHFDHAGGLAELKAATGARFFASARDADQLERGGKGDYLLGDEGPFPPIEVDRRLADGDRVRLGGTTLVARVTAGHTPGCTTWTTQVEEDGETLDVVFVCSVSILPGVRFLDQPSYPGIAEDYARTFETLASLPCDVFLAAHGSFFALSRKRERLRATPPPARNPFIDPKRYRAYVERGEKWYLERLEKERVVTE